MNFTHWYAVAIAGAAACLLFRRIGSVASEFLVSRFKALALRSIAYPLLLHRRYWTSITRLQGAVIGSYYIINGFCMGLGIRSRADLIARSGMMASINLIPLFLGGRTSMLANFLGISLHTYYLAHHWIGRLVVIQSLLHVALVIAAGKPWTFDSSQVSGISAASALALILLLSLYFVRRVMYEVFLKVHLFLSFVVVIGLLMHVAPAGSARSIFSIVALSLWGLNNFVRLLRMVYYNLGRRRGRKNQATITHFSGGSEDEVSAVRLTVQLPRERKVRPGEYYYLFMSDMGTGRRFQSHPYVVAWWDYPMAARSLSFLIQPQDGLSADLAGRKSVRRVLLDGPYGKDLHLDSCETIILIAKGIGIAGILPYVRHMTERRLLPDESWAYHYRRGLITRKIDVYWVLEDNAQQDWAADWIKELRDIDEKNIILTFSCFYPHKKVDPPPVSSNPHWRFLYQKEPLPIIEGLIVKQVQRSPGKTKVAVCGSSKFSYAVRGMVLKTMNEYRDVEFVETEFRPQGRQAHPGTHKMGKDDIEIAEVKGERRKRRTSRLGEMSVEIKSFRRKDKSSAAAEVKKQTHSGFATKLTTLSEAGDALKDLEEGLSDADDADDADVGRKVHIREAI